MSNVSKLQRKIETSSQFAQVASFIAQISVEGKLIDSHKYLAIDPWTDERLDSTVQNINTTLFCQLFSMKPTSCERNLRLYKQLHKG